MKEYKIGEQFTINIGTVERLESMSCQDCIFSGDKDMQICNRLACLASERSDDKNVIFKEIKE